MIVHILNDIKVIIVVTPRAGHFTILNLTKNINEINFNKIVMNNGRSQENFIWQRIHTRDLNLSKYKEYTKIKFVRNPYTRAVSSYYVLFNDKLMLHNSLAINQNDLYDLSFTEYLNILKTKNLFDIDHHLGFQTHEIDSEFNIFKIEKINEQKEEISNLIKTNLPKNIFEQSNKCNYKNKISIDDKVNNLSYRSIQKEYIGILNYKSFYDDMTKNLVENIFGQDIKNYDYKYGDYFE